MNKSRVWQRLLSLESRDIVSQWFQVIHERELNTRRAKEINSAAKQAREYFSNSDAASLSVRPLLTFYGVASLSRAFALLMKTNGGEEGLTAGHGLETVNWSAVLDGNVSNALRSLPSLQVRTTAGLLTDFITHTKNRVSIHVSSSAVDWRLSYDLPQIGAEISLIELLSRLPDLRDDFVTADGKPLYTNVNEMTYSPENGFSAKVSEQQLAEIRSFFEESDYAIADNQGWSTITCNADNFKAKLPLFVHSYTSTYFSIPSLHISKPFECGERFSQLGLTYLLSYFLGMLVRYYPTHWISLIQNEIGDTWWPTINMAQSYIEESFPELVIEMIEDILKTENV